MGTGMVKKIVEGVGMLDMADPRARVHGPATSAPQRRPGSVRRTTTIDMRWADGWGTDLLLEGRGRDLVTALDGSVTVAAESDLRMEVAPDRRIAAIETTPGREGVADLIGVGSGSGFRRALAEAVAGFSGADPIDLMLDDVPGATLVSGFAFAQWYPIEQLLQSSSSASATRRSMEGICTGFMPGSSGLAPDGTSRWTHRTRPVEPLDANDDDLAWHEIRDIPEVSMRRARRIDVWRDGDICRADAMFQDSATRPEGGRIAVHEYGLTATVDLSSGLLTSVTPEAHVLPYAECPLATLQVERLVDVAVADLRGVVLERLSGVAGCTHLNDAMRALADVLLLLDKLG
ncbi:DUF2889 domain-containing protein [Gordonia terrae]|uniref:DUF2889 domain-containing protein n=1 Tax=Gordonia terrae TaxID=2055 RepID=UPI00200AA57E|nr:DUF2889 domain-containing protein [Gordonia terrae]UPW08621.1 DUF2889 domain-containing protein [Gordonia terrae]